MQLVRNYELLNDLSANWLLLHRDENQQSWVSDLTFSSQSDDWSLAFAS